MTKKNYWDHCEHSPIPYILTFSTSNFHDHPIKVVPQLVS